MGFFCVYCGMTPADFWETTPFESNHLAGAYINKRKDEHRSRSWFTAHQMLASGMLPKGTRMRKVLEDLNAPIDKPKDTVEITSFEQMKAWEAEHAKIAQARERDDTAG